MTTNKNGMCYGGPWNGKEMSSVSEQVPLLGHKHTKEAVELTNEMIEEPVQIVYTGKYVWNGQAWNWREA